MWNERRLRRWREAGLIDDATVARIQAWEQQQQRPWLLYAIGGLGALTVALGFLALIAANWEAIGPVAKLGADLLAGGGLAFALLRTDVRSVENGGSGRWLREVLIVLLWGWTLASIGLVSQIYNMGGETWQALLLWNVLTALLVTRGTSGFVAALGYIGVGWTVVVMMMALGKRSGHEAWVMVPAQIVSTALLFASGSRRLARVRPAFARVAGAFGWTLLLFTIAAVPNAFYARWDGQDVERYFASIAVGLGCTLALLLFAPRLIEPLVDGEVPPRAAALLRVLFGLLLSVGVASLVLPHDRLGVVAALAFIALWGLVAAFAHASDQRRLLNTATAMIGVRLFIVYAEVFGSLLRTGVGMIVSGLIVLGLVWLWVRKSLRRAPAAPTQADSQINDDTGGTP